MFKDEDYLELMDNIEKENRKQFADNDLTLMSINESNDSEKWWNTSIIQHTSKLEISDLYSIKESSIDKRLSKKVLPVHDYFTLKSEMPSFLIDKDSGVNLVDRNVENLNDTLINEEPQSDRPLTDTNDENFTFSNTLFTSKSDNFSFTLNTSDTGDFILKKVSHSSKESKMRLSNETKNPKTSGSLTSSPTKQSFTQSSLIITNNQNQPNNKNPFKNHRNVEIQTSPDRNSTSSMYSFDKRDSKLSRTSTSSISLMGFVIFYFTFMSFTSGLLHYFANIAF